MRSFDASFVGAASSLFAVGITFTEIEQGIRVAGGLVGVAVGIVSFLVMLRKLRK